MNKIDKNAKGTFLDSKDDFSDDNDVSTREKTHEKDGEIAPKSK